jgi:hypothetical protein
MRSLLFLLVAFIALSAIFSGLLMISNPNGKLLSLSPTLLEGTLFKNFLVPGILLTIIVGGPNLMAVVYNIQRAPGRYNWAMAGGFAVIGWIIAQMILIHSALSFHFIYLGMGLVIILIAYQLKGKWVV